MIEIIEESASPPYKIFYEYYREAVHNKQESIDAICLSSYSMKHNEIDSRYVNLKYINNEDWIFFSNYNSKKSHDFSGHDQASLVLYWNKINFQLRMKGKIKATSHEFSNTHFNKRSSKKNALAISSNQSKTISSFEKVLENYNNTLNNENLNNRPLFWGGYSFKPYYFEFWTGHESRINKRVAYEKNENNWTSFILQP